MDCLKLHGHDIRLGVQAWPDFGPIPLLGDMQFTLLLPTIILQKILWAPGQKGY